MRVLVYILESDLQHITSYDEDFINKNYAEFLKRIEHYPFIKTCNMFQTMKRDVVQVSLGIYTYQAIRDVQKYHNNALTTDADFRS